MTIDTEAWPMRTVPRSLGIECEPRDPAAITDWFALLILRPVETPEIRALGSAAGISFLAGLGSELRAEDAAQAMIRFLNASSPEASERLLCRAYLLLFEGVSGPRTISLCEGSYAADVAAPFQAIHAILRALGMAPNSTCREPLDHLSIEMATLAEALRQDDRRLISSMAERLARWVPQLRHAIAEAGYSPFYTALFTLLDAFVAGLASSATIGGYNTCLSGDHNV